MRLTLRTLLAYLDDVLDPADKEELAQKIESSDFAKDLVHQTRDSVRRLRLSAPQVIGTGMGMDPNSVAEYLDNALAPEQVGDYERICLESDVHLAETAACHHVLTMVLGEPAEVEPRSRQRMYMIPAEARERRRLRAEPAHTRGPVAEATSPNVAAVGAPMVASRQPAEATTFEVPEYLRSRPWWQSRGALAALAAVLVVGTALYLVSGMMGWFGGPSDVVAVDIDVEEPPSLADTMAPRMESSTPETGVALPETSLAPAEDVAAPADPSTAPAETVATEPALVAPANPPATGERYPAAETNPTSQPLATPPQSPPPSLGSAPPVVAGETTAPATTSSPSDVGVAPSATADQTAAPGVEVSPEVPPVTDNAATVATTPPSGTETTGPVLDPSAAIPPQGDVPLDPSSATVPPTVPPAEAVATADNEARIEDVPGAPAVGGTDADSETIDEDTVPPGPTELGTYLSGKTVLLRYDEPQGGWFRVEPRSAVVAGERLLALPEFRPQVTLASGVMLDLSGGTQIVMMTGDAERGAGLEDAPAEVPMIDILYGRIILINTSNSEKRVRIKVGTNIGEARLKQNATLAVEVERPYVPGNDPRTMPAPMVVRMFVPDDGVTWKDASGEVVVDKPSRWTLTEGAAPEVVADSAPPEWIDQEPVVHLSEQRYGAPVIENTLVSDRPVDIQLLELFKGRDRREVKSLVTRSSIHVGLIAPFVDALRDSEQKWPTWRTHIETLRAAMAHSPESAELVFKALVDQRGRSAAADLYEMLCGYNAEQIGTNTEQLKTGALAKLIDWLEQDSLDYRVLAVHDLWEITGKQLMPNPAANATVRKQSVRRWRDRLQAGELEPVVKQEGERGR